MIKRRYMFLIVQKSGLVASAEVRLTVLSISSLLVVDEVMMIDVD